MDFVPYLSFYLTIGLFLSCVHGQTEIEIEDGNRKEQGATVNIICSVDYGTVKWFRKIGSLRIDLSDSMNIVIEHGQRYSLSQYWNEKGKSSTRLTIKDAKYEDSSQIGCYPAETRNKEAGTRNKEATTTLAVCEDTTSTACECIETNGWTMPTCFEKPVSVSKLEEKYDRTVVGLAVCLGIAVIFGVLMAIIVGWDCMAKVAAKKKKQMEMQKAKIAAKRAGYTGYEESEKIDLDPNDSMHAEYPNLKSGAQVPINAYSSMNPTNNLPPGNTHINKAYMIDDDADKYHEVNGGAAAASPYQPKYGYERGASASRVPEPAAEIEVHSVDDELRARMEQDRSTPEGSVGSARNNEPPSSASHPSSRYDVRGPRYNDYNSNKSPAAGYGQKGSSEYPALGFDKAASRQPSPYTGYNDNRTQSPGTWSTKSAGLPPSSAEANGDYYVPERNAYSEKPPRDYQGRSGYTEPRQLDFAYGKSANNSYGDSYGKSRAYVDNTDTVV